MTNTEEFARLWNGFTTRLRGSLLRRCSKRQPAISELSLILREAALAWDSGNEVCGRWLKSYGEVQPEKAGAIRTILLDELRFTEIERIPDHSGAVQAGIPIAGAIAGYAITEMLSAAVLLQAASIVLPPLLLYPAAKNAAASVTESGSRRLISEYMRQLEPFREQILAYIVD